MIENLESLIHWQYAWNSLYVFAETSVKMAVVWVFVLFGMTKILRKLIIKFYLIFNNMF